MEILNKIQKELKAPKGQKNTFGNYNYRSCEDILEAVKPLLGTATLTLSDEIVCVGAEPTILSETTKMPVSGYRFYVKATATISEGKESISVSSFARESLDKKGMDSAQITGAASSYSRKYALNGLFCIDDTKDADVPTTPIAEEKATAENKKKKLEAVKNLDELKTVWSGLSAIEKKTFLKIKDEIKCKLQPMTPEKNGSKQDEVKSQEVA